jgi:hypothetical protein
MPVCDGCGAQVDDAHIRARIERLELATRFRPIHIHSLLIDAAPPASPEDYFYAVGVNRSVRSVASRAYFDELMKCAGFASDAAIQEETALAEFQRRGIFLAYAIDCPIGESAELEATVRNLAPTVLLRVRSSYKPKHVALLSSATHELIQPLFDAGWKDRMILDSGGPFDDPFLADPAGQAEFNTAFGDRLSAALSRIA